MKKLLICALAAFTMLGAGCSKDPAVSEITAEQGGAYRLTTLSATLDDQDTRTSLGNNSVVNWSNNDRIAVVNLKTNDIKYYLLSMGAGTSVGKFEPVINPITFDSADDIKAVYPAIAAHVSDGKLSLSINKEYTTEELAKVGITSWTLNSSAYAFTNNDIKVSYSTSVKTSDDAVANVNFKFRQLGTWCNFLFDFNSVPEHALENMESLSITTADGLKKISGTSEVDFTDPNHPILKEGTENAIEWNTGGFLKNTFSKSLMLFPCIDGDKLKITVKTNMNTFVFYATPTQAFTAGTILQFPIYVGKNFEKDNSATANNFTYQVIPNESKIFYYYGESNCLLLAGANSGKLDITPYKTNVFYFNTKEMTTSAVKPESAAVIWREAGITRMDKPTITKESDGKYTLNITNVQGYGNALVGIYDDADNLLWSYHIWKPEFDPTAELLEYKYTNSGTYHVMPIALGATAKATVTSNGTATNETNAKALGYYYQWGRKDPLGRAKYIDSGTGNGTDGANYVTTYVGHEGTTPFNWAAAENNPNIKDAALLGSNTATDKDGRDIEEFMIEYAVKNPTHYIQVDGSAYDYSWCGRINNYLWGNPLGYEFPGKATLQRSIFEPCPKGYRVAPRDLWIAFLDEGGSHSSNANSEDTYANKFFNILNLSADGKTTTLADQKGLSFCYGLDENGVRKWQQEPADFYPASGSRIRSSAGGVLNGVGTHGFYWSSSPISSGSNMGGCFVFFATHVNVYCNYGRSDGMAIRCVKEQ